jgi:hypothetical protein
MGGEIALGLVGGVSAYVLSRRKCPWKLEKMLAQDNLQLPPGLTQELKLPEQDRVKLKEAFLNNTEYKWLSTQPGVEDRNHPNLPTTRSCWILLGTWWNVPCGSWNDLDFCWCNEIL